METPRRAGQLFLPEAGRSLTPRVQEVELDLKTHQEKRDAPVDVDYRLESEIIVHHQFFTSTATGGSQRVASHTWLAQLWH